LLVQPSSAPLDTWYLDSRASAHVTPDLNCFTSYTPYEGTEQLRVDDDSGLEISHTDSCYLGTNSQPLVLTNVLHVPTISKPLLSISKLVSNNDVVVEFNACSCFVKDRINQQVLLQGTLHSGLYTLSLSNNQPQALSCDVVSFERWNHLLAHVSPSVLQYIVSSKQLHCNSTKFQVCDSCSQAKSHKQPFLSSTTTTNKPLEFVHCDLWGPSPIVSHSGCRYYLLFTDQYSRFNWIYFCSNKSDVASLFEQFKSLIKNLFSTSIKTLQIDGGTEF
jgi:GAG-pre-integrase domain